MQGLPPFLCVAEYGGVANNLYMLIRKADIVSGLIFLAIILFIVVQIARFIMNIEIKPRIPHSERQYSINYQTKQ